MPNNEQGALDQYVAHISKALAGFSEQDPASKRELDRLAGANAGGFFAAGMHFVAAGESSPGVRYLVQLLANDKRLSNWLLDPKLCTLKAATSVACAAAEARVQVQASFEMALNKALQQQASASNTERILRILSLLEAAGSQSCWNSFQVELMAYPDKVVRSKAALLIGRSQKNLDWILRRLLDRDPRVQANAVETLWTLDAADTKPYLEAALESKHNRVFANAALGLYRSGDPAIIHVLLQATEHADTLFRISALWAIGQTQDPRFLPALTLQFKSAQGKQRLAIAGAISRIRKHEISRVQASPLQIAIGRAVVEADGKRTLSFTLSSRPPKNLSNLKPTEFQIWENGAPVEDYQVQAAAPADPMVVGFVAPWFDSAGDPTEKAIREGLLGCLLMKRKNDLWRIDRYSAAASANDPAAEPKPGEEAAIPYDDAALTAQIKSAQGWIPEADQLRRIIALLLPGARAASGKMAAIQRQCKSIVQRHAQRHIFVLLNGTATSLNQQTAIESLKSLVQERRLVLHGIALELGGEWKLFRELCLSNPEGGFIEAGEAGIADSMQREYASLCNKFQIGYSRAAREPAGNGPNVVLRVASDRGSGQTEVTLECATGPAEASAPAQAPAA